MNEPKLQRHLVLASTSKYRVQALSQLNLAFETADPGADEAPLADESPGAMALRLAHTKAAAIAQIIPEAVVIGSDQVGFCAGKRLGKPGSKEAAISQLAACSGQEAHFYTAVAVHDARQHHGECVVTRLLYRRFSAAQIRHYVDFDEPWDCAGSFKIESLGIALFTEVSSVDPTALIGLPLIATLSLLAKCGIAPLQ